MSARVTKRRRENTVGRVEARIPSEQKHLFQRAAAVRGVNLTTFMVDSMREAALRTLEQYESIKLTDQERRIFIETLLNPPPPNKALRAATERYKEMVSR